MRKLILILLLLGCFAVPVCAEEYTPPPVTGEAGERMPESTGSFGQDLWLLVREALFDLAPDLRDCAGACLKIFAVVMLISLLRTFGGISLRTVELVGVLAVGVILFSAGGTLIRLGADTVREISEYGKLLLPVLTGAMAAQGGVTASAALYGGTMIFQTVLTALISGLLVPLVYVMLALSVANCAIGDDLVKRLQEFVKWLSGWCLKTILYVFSGYMGITGVITGTTDAAALKVTKLTIAGMVPVVGGILSDASEAVLVGAGVAKNAAGIYGVLALLAIWIGPFLRIGIHYLLLKLTAAVCSVFDAKRVSQLVQDFSSTMGLLLGMTGSVCIMMLISTVCFLRGVG